MAVMGELEAARADVRGRMARVGGELARMDELVAERDEVIRDAVRVGLSTREVAEAFGLTMERVRQLTRSTK